MDVVKFQSGFFEEITEFERRKKKMGQLADKVTTPRVEYDENSENGLIFGEQYVPEELLVEILCCVDCKTLLNCQLVCKRWKILMDRYVWRKKAEMSLRRQLSWNRSIPWTLYYLICTKRPFERNLVKNHSGEFGVRRHWKVVNEGGDQWTVENPPIGVPPLPNDPVFEGKKFCFVTTYHMCGKQQVIDLEAEGLTPFILDKLQPTIVTSEWYSCRWDCPAVYQCSVELLKADDSLIDAILLNDDMEGDRQNQWFHMSHEFKNYGPGLRKIVFYHGGRDKSFWAGHYGSKMAGAQVYLKVPEVEQDISLETDSD